MKTILTLIISLQSLLILVSTDAMAMPGAFEWRRKGTGCLGKDSIITLSNGNEVKISSIKSSLLLQNIEGRDVGILHTTSGPEAQMIKITLESGKSVLATGDHPFISSTGSFITTSEITTATSLLTIDGDERVTETSAIVYNDKVYNLYLSSLELLNSGTTATQVKRQDPFTGLSAKAHTFFVNGIASGDLLIQKAL